jgi:hypothetical protein
VCAVPPARGNGRRLLFFRDFQRLQGGHLKVWDYCCHAAAAGWEVRVRFTEGSSWDESNPWRAAPEFVLPPREPFHPDVVFVAGLDWERLEGMAVSTPVINLIQHVRHSDPDDPRYRYLCRPAVRIAVSREVSEAVQATGLVRGPVVTIPNAVDASEFPITRRFEDRPVDILVSALRQKALGARVASRLQAGGRSVRLLTDHVARPLFLESLADAKIVVVLPDRVEGFCLPALEAMALGALVVVPNVVGNRSFCLAGVNCLMPEFDEESVVAAVERAVALSTADSERLRGEAARMVAKHSLDHERSRFHGVLAQLDELWAKAANSPS